LARRRFGATSGQAAVSNRPNAVCALVDKTPCERGASAPISPGPATLFEELIGYGQTAQMPPGRHKRHRAQSIADKARTARAVAMAAELAPLISELRASGVTTLQSIADELNRRGVPTPAGRGRWHTVQVSRVLKRLSE
jgi:hypothetical protein